MKKLLTPTELLDKFLTWFTKEKRQIFLITFIVGIIANILVLTTNIISTDAVVLGDVYIAGAWDLSIGRWLLKFTEMSRFGLAVSAVTGVFSLMIMSFISILLIDLFKIKSKISKYLISILLVVSPFFADTLLSVYCASDFTLAFLFSVLSVYFLYNIKNKWISLILSSLTLAFSLGLYQAYLGVTCGLCIMLPLIYVLKGEITPKEALIKLLKSLIMGIIGIVFYEIILQVLLTVNNVEMSTYGGANEIGINTILEIPNNIKNAYTSFYNYFMNDNLINNIIYRREYFNILIFILILIGIIKLYIKNKYKKSIILILQIILSIILLPVALSILELIAPNRPIYGLMTAPYILIYILVLALIDGLDTKLTSKLICYIGLLASLFIVHSYFIMNNATYITVNITKEKTEFAANRIINQIYDNEDYNIDTKVLFIGTATGPYFENKSTSHKLSSSNSLYEPLMWSEDNLTNNGWHNFIKYYLGINLNKASMDDYNKIINTKEFKEMETYPSKECIKLINDTIIVKIQ